MENDDPENLKPKKKKPKVASEVPFDMEELRSILKNALNTHIEEKKINVKLEIDAMVSTMEEFLKSFIVIGYDFKGEPIFIVNAKTQLEADALSNSLARIFHSGGNF
jgi:hypothetical protein